MKKKIVKIVVMVILVCVSCVILAGCTTNEGAFAKDEIVKIQRLERPDGNTTIAHFGKTVEFNTVVLEENNDKVELFEMYYNKGGEWVMFYRQDRIDKYRLCAVPKVTTDKIKVVILKKMATTKISGIKVYNVKQKSENFRVTSYFVWDGIAEKQNDPDFKGYFNSLTDVMMIGKLALNNEGAVTYGSATEPYSEEKFTSDLAALRNVIGENDVKVRVSMRISQEGGNSAVAKFINHKIDVITKTLVEFTTKYNIDGIDYDWEYPENNEQWKAYEKIIVKTAEALNPIHKTVTVALPPWGVKFSKATIDKIEFVNLMSYDLFDSRGDHASIYKTTVDAVNTIRAAHIPKEKIMLGLSFYGRTANGSADAWPDFRACGAMLGQWGNIVENYEYKTKEGVTEMSRGYVNGYAMNRDKTAYAIAAGLGGVMIFRSQCDMPYSYEFSLHKAVEQAVSERIK